MSYFFVAANPGVAAALQQLRVAAQTAGPSSALGGASLVGAGAAVVFIAGDSSPKPVPVVPNPFEGISRFMSRASAVIDMATADPEAAALAVGLPEDASFTTVADVDPLDRLADALRAWDGMAPLEVGGFIFERLSGAGVVPVVKITIATERVSDIIRVAQEVRVAFSPTTQIETVVVDSDALGIELLRWGHRCHNALFSELKGYLPQLLSINGKLKQGEEISDADKALLCTITQKIQDQKIAMALNLDVLKTLLYNTNEHTKQIFQGVVHDVNPRLAYLQLFGIPVSLLEMGVVLGESEFELLDKFDQVSLDYAVRYAVALAKLDLKNSAVLVEINVGGLDIELVRQEDFDKVTDILANLISNASRYSDPKKAKPTITVSARREREGLVIEVSDNGIGISEEKLKELGQFKFRVGEKDVEGSQGIGLWHVLKQLQELGWGDLWVQSTHGEGSTFRFVIPDPALRYSSDFMPVTPAPKYDQTSNGRFYKLSSHHE